MQLAARSYLAAGVALVGASAIAVSPVAPSTPEVYTPVALTAAIDNPVTVFAPVATATQELIASVIERQTSNPAPILRQLGANAVAGYQSFMSTPPAYLIAYALTNVVIGAQEFGPNLNNFGTVTSESLTALATILGDMGEGLPALLQAAGAQLAAGNPNGAIDAIMLAGLQPGVDLLMNVLTPEMNAIGQLLGVPQPLTDAAANAVIGVALGAIISTVGIGFDLGDPQPVVKGFISGVQTVLAGAASGDPATFVNSVQHGVAKFALDVIGQAGQMNDSINFAVDGFVDALKQIAPKPFTPPDITIPTAKALAAPAPATLVAASVADEVSAPAPIAKADTASDAEATETGTETETAAEAPKADGDDTGTAAGTVTKVSTKAAVKASPKAQVKADSPAKTVREQVKSAVKKVTGGLKKEKAGTEKKAESSNDSAKGSDAE
ncbi:hypothetical protein [Mycolicibacterium neworleansense]|uniref:PE-PGRS family protein n=1 Tax=Mycolicibacterium neworleansense TaxID=146018 RepID=A0A0H5RXD9_9MYCO|nr:hypothetical protein [Mycolicibacterium neworleansense]MCV7360788.1 hypothetical protein [Mycolicibacterium neworleansense]CRZ18207.1 hypothetical protein BN2156_05108 [Mycolicibacterium neworleansense]